MRSAKEILNDIVPYRSFNVLLPRSDADLLKKKCRLMPITPEQYIANLVAMAVRPDDGGFRILTRWGNLIDSKGKSIDEYMDEILSE